MTRKIHTHYVAILNVVFVVVVCEKNNTNDTTRFCALVLRNFQSDQLGSGGDDTAVNEKTLKKEKKAK